MRTIIIALTMAAIGCTSVQDDSAAQTSAAITALRDLLGEDVHPIIPNSDVDRSLASDLDDGDPSIIVICSWGGSETCKCCCNSRGDCSCNSCRGFGP